MATVIIIIYYSINDKALGQQEQEQQQPTNNTDNLEIIIQQNNRIIQQNDETAIKDRAITYIGSIALLVSLALVIYGFQISRGGKKQKNNTTLPFDNYYHCWFQCLFS